MCLIVDANVAPAFFCTEEPAYTPLWRAVVSGHCCIYYGGELRREYGKIDRAFRVLLNLDRAGRAKAFPDQPIDEITNDLKEAGVCTSNDEHVIALARISECRLLCSNDRALGDDFKNKDLLDKPRGSVYKNASHVHLLRKHCRNG